MRSIRKGDVGTKRPTTAIYTSSDIGARHNESVSFPPNPPYCLYPLAVFLGTALTGHARKENLQPSIHGGGRGKQFAALRPATFQSCICQSFFVCFCFRQDPFFFLLCFALQSKSRHSKLDQEIMAEGGHTNDATMFGPPFLFVGNFVGTAWVKPPRSSQLSGIPYGRTKLV